MLEDVRTTIDGEIITDIRSTTSDDGLSYKEITVAFNNKTARDNACLRNIWMADRKITGKPTDISWNIREQWINPFLSLTANKNKDAPSPSLPKKTERNTNTSTNNTPLHFTSNNNSKLNRTNGIRKDYRQDNLNTFTRFNKENSVDPHNSKPHLTNFLLPRTTATSTNRTPINMNKLKERQKRQALKQKSNVNAPPQ